MALIWVLSSLRLGHVPIEVVPLRDKGVHFLEYALLGLLVARAATRTWPSVPTWRAAAIAVLVTASWGVLDELHQAFVPGRAAEMLDVLADTVGAIAGVCFYVLLQRARFRRGPESET